MTRNIAMDDEGLSDANVALPAERQAYREEDAIIRPRSFRYRAAARYRCSFIMGPS